MSLRMSIEERQAFLADLHVGVLSVIDADGRAPLTVPVWYSYQPGGVVSFITGGTNRKTGRLRQAGRCSLCAQNEEPPYRYVTVEGPVAIESPVDEEERREMARRYLGTEGGDAYVAATASEIEEMVVVRIRPEHWLSVDYGKLTL